MTVRMTKLPKKILNLNFSNLQFNFRIPLSRYVKHSSVMTTLGMEMITRTDLNPSESYRLTKVNRRLAHHCKYPF